MDVAQHCHVREPTQSQAEVLVVIAEFSSRNRYQPSHSDIAKALNVSPAAVRQRLMWLRQKGHVDWVDHIDRTVHVTELGERFLRARG
jgi:Mn-dependent DtxR family transcriptional regulator